LAADIQSKWSKWGAAQFGLNPSLKAALALPALTADDYLAHSGQTLSVAAPGVLENDHHINQGQAGIALQAQISVAPLHGQVTLKADGSFSYVPESGYVGTATKGDCRSLGTVSEHTGALLVQ